MKTYKVNEIFYSLQGEGHWTGTPMAFVRLSLCNLRCPFCDTDFATSTDMTAEDILESVRLPRRSAPRNDECRSTPLDDECRSAPRNDERSEESQTSPRLSAPLDDEPLEETSPHVCFTGGEPALQLDDELVNTFKEAGYIIHIETNGTHPLPEGIDWITCSPKTDWDPRAKVVLESMNEVKVVYTGQDVEKWTALNAKEYFLQPCSGQNTEEVVRYILGHPHWRLSLQTHKLLNIK